MTHNDNRTLSNGEISFAIGIPILLLALAVFGWGLHSKLSLYHVRAHPAVTAPVAKLLSERERPAVQAQHCDINQADLHLVALAAVAALLPHPEPRTQPRAGAAPPAPRFAPALQGPSLRRPPPPLAIA